MKKPITENIKNIFMVRNMKNPVTKYKYFNGKEYKNPVTKYNCIFIVRNIKNPVTTIQ